MIIPAPTATALRALRAELGISAAKMAELAGYGHLQDWQAVETGRRKMSRQKYELLLLALGRHPTHKLTARRQ